MIAPVLKIGFGVNEILICAYSLFFSFLTIFLSHKFAKNFFFEQNEKTQKLENYFDHLVLAFKEEEEKKGDASAFFATFLFFRTSSFFNSSNQTLYPPPSGVEESIQRLITPLYIARGHIIVPSTSSHTG